MIKRLTGADRPLAIFLVALVVLVPGCVRGTTSGPDLIRYVSTTGNDQASGVSQSRAWRTITHAARELKAGGEVRVLPGTYSEEVQEYRVGTRRPLRIIGFGGRPVLDGKRRLKIGLWFAEPRGVIVRNLEIQNFTDVGVGAEGGREVVFHNLSVHDNGFRVQLVDWELEGYGINIDTVNGYTVEKNDVFRNGPRPQRFPDWLMGTGINTFGSRNGLIRRNKSHHNVGGGILVEDSFDIRVKENEVYQNDLDATEDGWWDGGIWLDGGGRVSIEENDFHDNIGPGILISDEDDQSPRGYVLKNNKSRDNLFGVYIWNFAKATWPPRKVLNRAGNMVKGNKIRNVVISPRDYDPATLNWQVQE